MSFKSAFNRYFSVKSKFFLRIVFFDILLQNLKGE